MSMLETVFGAQVTAMTYASMASRRTPQRTHCYPHVRSTRE